MNRDKNIKAILSGKSVEKIAEKLYEKKYSYALLDYFNISPNEKFSKEEFTAKGTSKGEKTTVVANDYPTLYGFLTKFGLTKAVFDAWCATHVEFARAYDMTKGAQLNALLVNALNGNYNATIAKLELTATHGMCEDATEGPLEVKLTVI